MKRVDIVCVIIMNKSTSFKHDLNINQLFRPYLRKHMSQVNYLTFRVAIDERVLYIILRAVVLDKSLILKKT